MQFDKDIIYKSLKKIDKECLDVTNSKKFTDEEYFKSGIYLDLVSNLLAIYINDNTYGIGSLGINLNCRLILESICIIKMYENKELGPINYELYRDSYVMIEYGNESKFYNDAEALNFFKLENNSAKRKAFLDKWSKKLNIDRQKLKLKSKDSSFFLLKDIKPTNMIKKYIGDFSGAYQFLGMLIHPCIFDDEIYKMFSELRTKLITEIYQYGLTFLNERKPFLDNTMPSFEEDKKFKLTDEHLRAISIIGKILSNLNYKTSHFSHGKSSLCYRTTGELICIWRDIALCKAFAHNDQAVIKVKIFIEYMSMYIKISEYQNPDDFQYIFEAYKLTSIAQCIGFAGDTKFSNIENRIFELYENYYKNKYPNIKKEYFVSNIKNNSLYFINGCRHDKKSYRDLVNEALNLYYEKFPHDKQQIYDYYRISLDAAHSSGYLFTSCNYIFSACARYIEYFMFTYFENYFQSMKEKFSQKFFANEIFPEEEFNKLRILCDALELSMYETPKGVNIYTDPKS